MALARDKAAETMARVDVVIGVVDTWLPQTVPASRFSAIAGLIQG
jgi:hypothetical protein